MAFVVDNSVVVAWFVGNQATAYTNRMRERARREAVHAPAGWPLEFLNALWALERRKLLPVYKVDEILTKALRFEIIIHMEPIDLPALLNLSRAVALPAYDASYLQLALRLGMPLAVKDVPIVRAAHRVGIAIAR